MDPCASLSGRAWEVGTTRTLGGRERYLALTPLSTKPIDVGFGVIIDADLTVPLPPEQQAELYQLCNEHGLVVFEGQDLDRNQQIRAMSYLRRGRYLERDPELVSNVGAAGFVGSTPLDFHSDSAFLPEPIGAISLLAVDVVTGATTTMFANAQQTYERLPPEFRRRIDELHTVHVMPQEVYARNRIRNLPSHYPRTTRLLAHRHGVTGHPVLYVSWVMIDGIVELSEAESDALLDELHGYVSDPAHVYEHQWQNGDLVMWDNVTVLHARNDTSDHGTRVLQRASTGAYHFTDIYPEFPLFSMKYQYQDK